VLDALAAAVARHVSLPPAAATAVALWILHTHAIESARISPRLAILSPLKRCGKSTLLKLIAALVRSALPTANITSAALFRVVEAHAPTLLVDEADTFLRDREELRGVLNAGHDRETPVIRCVGDDFEARRFAVFAPVAIAAIGRLPDTIADRSIIVSMRRKTPGEAVERCRRRERAALGDLRRKCERWASDHAAALRDAAPRVPDELDDRAADNWEPLLAIADAAGPRWSERVRAAALLLSGTTSESDDGATRSRCSSPTFAPSSPSARSIASRPRRSSPTSRTWRGVRGRRPTMDDP
jgi:putative DNA primase/helicase